MKKKKWDVVVLGGINSDFTIQGEALPKPGQTVMGRTFYSGPGGKGANQAVAAARFGARTAIIGQVGKDARGRELVRNLKDQGVETRFVSVDPEAPTGAAIIAVDRSGEKQISAALGANHLLKPEQICAAEEIIASAKVLLMQFEAPMRCVLLAAELAARHGAQVVLDPAPPVKMPRKLFSLLDVIRPNADEAEQMVGFPVTDKASARKAARELMRRGVKTVALQAGGEGDLMVNEEGEWFLPRVKVKSVDATGAGDAFIGTFAACLAKGWPWEQIGRMANTAAALSTTRMGAQEALPTLAQVEKFLRSENRKSLKGK